MACRLLVGVSLLLLLSLHLMNVGEAVHLRPLVIIPGIGNSQIYARVTEEYLPSNRTVCGSVNRSAGWFRLWENKKLLGDPLVQCFAELMAIHYDPDLDDYHNTPGVETRVPSFGSVDSFRRCDPDDLNKTSEMAILLERLEALGYQDGKNLFGAPYDFRYGLGAPGHPSREGTRFLDSLRALVEHASSANGGNPVILFGHSLGGLLVHQLLTRNSPGWRHRFVDHFVAVAVPWKGTVIEVEIFASGVSIAGLASSVLRDELRTYESNLWMLPSPLAFGSKPLVVTPKRNYTAADLSQFLSDVGFPEAVLPYQARVLPMVAGPLDPPGIPVTCVFGTEIPTVGMLVYGDGFGRGVEPVEVEFGAGDGEVNLESLEAAEAQWAAVDGQTLKSVKVANATHGSILLETKTWEMITQLAIIFREDDDKGAVDMASSATRRWAVV